MIADTLFEAPLDERNLAVPQTPDASPSGDDSPVGVSQSRNNLPVEFRVEVADAVNEGRNQPGVGAKEILCGLA